ncbi:pilus assembly protein [Erysipelotrichaceae bacterium OH741_COT-311]|nr:pilus assembly protein [Erysipelotrichaceae bacterium OH741_COT-311]
MKYKERLKKIYKVERGQGLVEFALTAILFFTLVFLIIDVGYTGFRIIMFDYSYQQSTWRLFPYDSDPNAVKTIDFNQYHASNMIKDHIVDYGIAINKKDLYVNTYTFRIFTEHVTHNKHPDGTPIKEKRRYLKIDAEIKYKFKPLTPFGELIFGKEVVLNKRLDRLRLLQSKSN